MAHFDSDILQPRSHPKITALSNLRSCIFSALDRNTRLGFHEWRQNWRVVREGNNLGQGCPKVEEFDEHFPPNFVGQGGTGTHVFL